jgi:GntR family transcriptional regulator, phosphonate transport system regulatory protein
MVVVWRTIERELRSEIASGRLAPGQKLPTEHELASQFNVHRNSIRKVIGRLTEAGLVNTHRGRGAFVRERVVPFRVSMRTRFSDNLKRAGVEPTTRLIEAAEQPADRDLQHQMGLANGSVVHCLLIVNEANKRPISLTRYYFPSRRFPEFGRRFSHELSVTRTLKSFGVTDYTRKMFRISSRVPTRIACSSCLSPANSRAPRRPAG